MIAWPMVLNPAAMRLALALAAVAAVFGAGAYAGVRWSEGELERERAQHARAQADAERRHSDALEAVRRRESALIEQTERIVDDAREVVAQAQRDAAAADAAQGRLLDAARAAARRCTAGAAAGAAGRGAPAPAAGDLLADVLGRIDQAAGDLARHADAARSAGLTCERAWDAARQTLK